MGVRARRPKSCIPASWWAATWLTWKVACDAELCLVNGFHTTVLDKFYCVASRKKFYGTSEELRPTWMLRSGVTMNSGRIKDVGVSARRQYTPSSTGCHWYERNYSSVAIPDI